jgi:DNA invertase Pin-like site-specific DNA recombinase
MPVVSSTALAKPIRAAQYVRMSTEHQKYSTQNQLARLAHYAGLHNLQIVRTYADPGKSGLTLEGREGLGNLLSDVVSGQADYSMILVYDVSRWGRFQDVDESAYYEFVCKRANVRVEYCAEPFRNDTTMPSALLKTMKRTMAAEFSRELSEKVFAGQCRLVRLGFRQGGAAPRYGLRRLLVDEKGKPKQILLPGQHKSIHTDRVILVPGTSDEVDVVREIFDTFTGGGRSESQIAKALNARGVPFVDNRPWSFKQVHNILTQPNYAGINAYYRKTQRLKTKLVRNPREKWIVCENAFTPIVSPKQFWKAAEIIAARKPEPLTRERLLAAAGEVFSKYGELSRKHFDSDKGVPCGGAYYNHFGGTLPLYKLLGVSVPARLKYLERRLEELQFKKRHLAWIVDQLRAGGAAVEYVIPNTLIRVNSEFTVALRLATFERSRAGNVRWQVGVRPPSAPDITIVARLRPDRADIMDYFLFPKKELLPQDLRLRLENGPLWESYRFDNLDCLFRMARRSSVWEVKCRPEYRKLAASLLPVAAAPTAGLATNRSNCANLATSLGIRPNS